MDRNRFIQCMKSNIELSDKERRRIIRKSVESQPWKLKCTIAMEEFAELTQAISKQIRGYDNRIGLLEEMADAYICLEFLKSIFNITPEELQKAMDVKLQYLIISFGRVLTAVFIFILKRGRSKEEELIENVYMSIIS